MGYLNPLLDPSKLVRGTWSGWGQALGMFPSLVRCSRISPSSLGDERPVQTELQTSGVGLIHRQKTFCLGSWS